MSMARLMTAATLRSATVKSSPSRYGVLAKAASSTLNGAAMTFSASSRKAALRSCGGRRTACSDQILTPRSTSAMAQKLHCQALASPSSVAGIELAERMLLGEIERDRQRLEQHEAVVDDDRQPAVGIDRQKFRRRARRHRRSRSADARNRAQAPSPPTTPERRGCGRCRRYAGRTCGLSRFGGRP